MGPGTQRTRQELQQRTAPRVPVNSLGTEDKCQSAHGGIRKMQVVMGDTAVMAVGGWGEYSARQRAGPGIR